MNIVTRTGVKCGNHYQPTYHANVTEVRDCFRNSGKGIQRVESLDEKLDKAFGELDAFDAEIQRREREEDERVARAKLDRDVPVCPVTKPVSKEGVYRNPQTGDIFKVYRTVHGANQLVAKKLVVLPEAQWYPKTVRGKETTVKAEFEYQGKTGLRGLTESMLMTLEEAKQYGALYGVCVRCGLTLTKEKSIERAMGDVCAAKENWA